MDDGRSLISEQSSSTRRNNNNNVGRVRFSDDEDETVTAGFETVTIRGRFPKSSNNPLSSTIIMNGNGGKGGGGVDLANSKSSGSLTMGGGRSESMSSPSTSTPTGVLSGAKKNMMKMFHRTTTSSSSP